VYCNDIAVLDSKIVTDNAVHSGAPIVKIIIRQHDQHSILSLLALHQDCVATKELQCLHGVV